MLELKGILFKQKITYCDNILPFFQKLFSIILVK